jgi:hypothetical protein
MSRSVSTEHLWRDRLCLAFSARVQRGSTSHGVSTQPAGSAPGAHAFRLLTSMGARTSGACKSRNGRRMPRGRAESGSARSGVRPPTSLSMSLDASASEVFLCSPCAPRPRGPRSQSTSTARSEVSESLRLRLKSGREVGLGPRVRQRSRQRARWASGAHPGPCAVRLARNFGHLLHHRAEQIRKSHPPIRPANLSLVELHTLRWHREWFRVENKDPATAVRVPT